MIYKSNHEKNFFQMSNAPVQDPGLSWAAKGFLAYFLSLPETWEVHLRDLFVRSTSGRFATETALKELIEAGYVKKIQGGNKCRDTKYTVYEDPALCPERTQ